MIVLDFGTGTVYFKLQYWPWSVEDAHLFLGLKVSWGKMKEFRVQCVISPYLFWEHEKCFITVVEIVVLDFNKCMQLEDAPVGLLRWTCLTILCPTSKFLARILGAAAILRVLSTWNVAEAYINTKVPWW